MAQLYVYTTEGTCIYPESASDDPSINRYFESVNFVADLRDRDSPSIEAYFRAVLPGGRPEQLFLRFQGDDPDAVFADCRDAVTTELVEQRDWEIQETTDNSDPSMLFQRAVLQPAPDPSQVLGGTVLEGREELLRLATRSGEQLTVTGRSYETIADAIRAFADSQIVIAVADGDISLSQAQLLFERQAQQHSLGLPRESQRLLNRVAEQSVDAEQTGTPVEQKQTAAAGEQRVAASDSTLSTDSERVGDRRDSGSSVPVGDRSSGRLPDVVSGLPATVVGGAGVVVVLVLAGVVAFAVMGSGGSSPAEPDLEVNITDTPESVVRGENVTIGYEISNTGEAATTANISVSIGGEEVDATKDANITSGDSLENQIEYPIEENSEVEVLVEADNKADSSTIRVDEPARFDVEIDSVIEQCGNSPIDDEAVTKGGTVEVGYEVTNTGDVESTQTVTGEFGKQREKTAEVTVGGGESSSETFRFEPDTTGETSVRISADTSDTRSVTVQEPFGVEITSPEDGREVSPLLEVKFNLMSDSQVSDDTQCLTVKGEAPSSETNEKIKTGTESLIVPIDSDGTLRVAVGDNSDQIRVNTES